MTLITPTPPALARLRHTGELLVVERVEPQPPKGFEFAGLESIDPPVILFTHPTDPGYATARDPLGPPGTEHGVGEEWAIIQEGGFGDPENEEEYFPNYEVYYRSDGKRDLLWNPASSLPDLRVRTRVVVESVEVKRAGEMNPFHIVDAGYGRYCETAGAFYGFWPEGERRAEIMGIPEAVMGLRPTDFAWFTRLAVSPC